MKYMNENRNTITQLLLILVFALFLRLFFFHGIHPSDGIGYITQAYGIFVQNEIPSTGALRAGMLVPLGIIMKLFGPSESLMTSFYLMISLVNILLAFLIGKALVNNKVGLLAALLMTVIPIEIIYATTIWPDPVIQMFHGLAALCLINFFKQDLDSSKKIVYIILTGVFSGFAFLVKITGIFFIVVALVVLFIKKTNWRYFIYLGAGLLLVFCLELVWSKIILGSFGGRVALLTDVRERVPQWLYEPTDQHGRTYILLYRFLLSYPKLLLRPFNGMLGPYYTIALFLLAIYLIRRKNYQLKNESVIFLFIWLVIIYCSINFLITKIPPPVIPAMRPKVRYLWQLNIPISVFTSILIINITNNKKLRYGIISFALLLSLISSIMLISKRASHRRASYYSVHLSRFLSENTTPSNAVYADVHVRWLLPFYTNFSYDFELKSIYEMNLNSLQKGDLVVYNEKTFENYWRRYSHARPESEQEMSALAKYLMNPPDNWDEIYQVDDPFNMATFIRNRAERVFGLQPFEKTKYLAKIYKINHSCPK